MTKRPMRSGHRCRWPTYAMLVIACLGCGSSDGRMAVKGNVMLEGVPLETGEIVFLPTGSTQGPVAAGEIKNGEFLIPAAKGPVAGTYRVEITADRKTGKKIQADESSSELVDQYAQYLPARYNDLSELTAEIQPRGEPLQFELSSR